MAFSIELPVNCIQAKAWFELSAFLDLDARPLFVLGEYFYNYIDGTTAHSLTHCPRVCVRVSVCAQLTSVGFSEIA